MRVLVTNDDGIDSPGLHALARALAAAHEVVVVAPAQDMSGVGAAIGRISPDQRIRLRPARIEHAPDVRASSLDGPPGLAVMAACLGAFGEPPDVVVTGVNAGPNTGHACLHSGTVGAALTASTFGVSALATSVQVGDPMQWTTACRMLDEPLGILAGAEPGAVLNMNAPALPPERVRGLRWATLDRFGRVRLALAARSPEWLQLEYRQTGTDLDPSCDTALLERGFATLTAIEGIAEVPREALARQARPRAQPEVVVSGVPGGRDERAQAGETRGREGD